MSANNQILVKEHKGKYYVFDVMAETWGDWDYGTGKELSDNNYLHVNEAKAAFDTREEAHKFGHKLDDEADIFPSEYGVVDEVLYKDGAPVVIVEEQPNE